MSAAVSFVIGNNAPSWTSCISTPWIREAWLSTIVDHVKPAPPSDHFAHITHDHDIDPHPSPPSTAFIASGVSSSPMEMAGLAWEACDALQFAATHPEVKHLHFFADNTAALKTIFDPKPMAGQMAVSLKLLVYTHNIV
ncbi:hypothetical protein B0H13DRAFT_2309879 [Mycena leptocephala]|nr:hypothetical protein B0H13DRAFT_2309879 [Mycena leptocephala]